LPLPILANGSFNNKPGYFTLSCETRTNRWEHIIPQKNDAPSELKTGLH